MVIVERHSTISKSGTARQWLPVLDSYRTLAIWRCLGSRFPGALRGFGRKVGQPLELSPHLPRVPQRVRGAVVYDSARLRSRSFFVGASQ